MNVKRILLEVLSERRTVPFAWGRADCATFASDCAAAIIDRDPLADVRGTYDSALSAARVLKDRGWHDVAGFAAAHFREVAVSMAQVGDWVIVADDTTREPTLGVVFGGEVAARGKDAIGLVPLTAATRAFRVE